MTPSVVPAGMAGGLVMLMGVAIFGVATFMYWPIWRL
jgi:hypothetical protein